MSINVMPTRSPSTEPKTKHQIQLSLIIAQGKQIAPHATSNNTRCRNNHNIIIKCKPIHTKITTASTIFTCTIRMTCQLTMEWVFFANIEIVVQLDLIFLDKLLKNVVKHSNRHRKEILNVKHKIKIKQRKMMK